jgi:hypothetical protein
VYFGSIKRFDILELGLMLCSIAMSLINGPKSIRLLIFPCTCGSKSILGVILCFGQWFYRIFIVQVFLKNRRQKAAGMIGGIALMDG